MSIDMALLFVFIYVMKYLLLTAFILTSFPHIATADETYDEFARDMQKLRDMREKEDQEWHDRYKKEDPFDVIKTPKEDKLKYYSNDSTTVELNNNMSPKGKTSAGVFRDMFKTVDD